MGMAISQEVSHLVGNHMGNGICKAVWIITEGGYLITEDKCLIPMIQIAPVHLFCQTEE